MQSNRREFSVMREYIEWGCHFVFMASLFHHALPAGVTDAIYRVYNKADIKPRMVGKGYWKVVISVYALEFGTEVT